jgi:heme/copper-type cytochrome/quinol oxidase subunit 4
VPAWLAVHPITEKSPPSWAYVLPVLDDWNLDFKFDLAIPPGRVPLMWCLIAFLLTFLVTRTIVRYIRAQAGSTAPKKWWQPRNIGHGTTHIHHVVIGVILVMVSGLTMVTLAVDGGVPEFTAAAIIFGMGSALVLDEFALILHLQDVYWSEDGRTSIDAVFAAVAVAGLLILGFNPLSFFDITI